MGQAFEFSFPFLLRDRLRATVALWPMHRAGIVANILLPLVGAFALTLSVVGPFANGNWLSVIGIAFVVLPLCQILAVSMGYALNPVAREPFRYVIDEQGIHVFAKSIDYTHHWSVVSRVVRRAGFLMLFFRPGCAHCLPRPALDASGQLPELLAFLEARGLKVN